jgi:hypothetical protein
VKPKAAAPFVDAPAGFKHLAVKRELEKDQWVYNEAAPVTEFASTEEVSKQPSDTPFGPTAPDLGKVDPESMKMTRHASVNGGAKIAVSN